MHLEGPAYTERGTWTICTIWLFARACVSASLKMRTHSCNVTRRLCLVRGTAASLLGVPFSLSFFVSRAVDCCADLVVLHEQQPNMDDGDNC